jgi:hypothetical protein
VATAKQEITDFLASKEAGIVSQYTKATLQNAAEKMFTANGLPCPVAIVESDGVAYILNRERAFSDNAQ